MEHKSESQKLGEQILESLRKQGVPIPGEFQKT